MVGGLGPHEGARDAVMGLQVVLDGAFKLDGGAVRATTDLPFGERGEETLDLIDPGSRRWSEVRVETRMTGQPATHSDGFVCAVVVQDDMNVAVCRDVRLEGIQKPAEFLRTMAAMQLAAHTADL